MVDSLLLLLLAPAPLVYRALRTRSRTATRSHHHSLVALGEVAERSRRYRGSAAA